MSEKLLKILSFPTRTRPQNQKPDVDLIAQIQADGSEAWAIFLSRYTDLIYRKAQEFSRVPQHGTRNLDDLEDEAADLYLFMANYLKKSLIAFRGECKARTWVIAIISNQPRILKAYLYQKDPDRTDIRLPRILTSRTETDREIFKRLVWGFDPAYIAQDLNLPEHTCWEIEHLLSEHSPRVYERILANRAARAPTISMDAQEDDPETDGGPRLQIADPGLDPEQRLEKEALQIALQDGIREGLHTLTVEERRVLILLYNEGIPPANIVKLAASDENLSLPQNINLNRIYYLKDRALKKILDKILQRLEREGQKPESEVQKRSLISNLEEVLEAYSIPIQPTFFSE